MNTHLLRANAAGDEPALRGRALASDLGDLVPEVIMYMPGGTHTINCSRGARSCTVTVLVDRSTAAVAQQSLSDYLAGSRQRPCFDFNHDECEAAGWPTEFFWADSPEPGVYARVEWSDAGRDAIQGKRYRSFSPTFDVDFKANPSPVKARKLTFMGALTNDPAFKQIRPLWAKAAGAQSSKEHTSIPMTEQEIAALQAKLKQLEQENIALKAKAVTAENADALKARETEHAEALQAKQAEIDAITAKLSQAETAIKAQRTKEADAAVKAAVARGAIAPKDEALQAKWRGLIETDPSNEVLLAGMQGSPALTSGRLTSGVIITGEDIATVVKAYMSNPNHRERGVLYAKELRKRMVDPDSCDAVIRATNTLGTALGTLIVQRTLDLLKISFPLLGRVSTNFTDQQAKYGEAITTRLITVPTVGTYSTSTGYPVANTTATDVAVTINLHKCIQVAFNANELAGTRRLLFGEQDEAMHYALGKDLVDALYALITTGNYTETPTTIAQVDFARKGVITIGTAMQTSSAGRNANTGTRSLLLNPDYYGQLAEDLTVVGNLNNPAGGSAISSGILPMVHGFLPIEAPNLPTTGNLTGFGLRADAMAMATAIPTEYANQPGVPSTALQQIITNPDTGMSVQLTIFVDHLLGLCYMRLAWMYGVAKANAMAGQILRSAA